MPQLILNTSDIKKGLLTIPVFIQQLENADNDTTVTSPIYR